MILINVVGGTVGDMAMIRSLECVTRTRELFVTDTIATHPHIALTGVQISYSFLNILVSLISQQSCLTLLIAVLLEYLGHPPVLSLYDPYAHSTPGDQGNIGDIFAKKTINPGPPPPPFSLSSTVNHKLSNSNNNGSNSGSLRGNSLASTGTFQSSSSTSEKSGNARNGSKKVTTFPIDRETALSNNDGRIKEKDRNTDKGRLTENERNIVVLNTAKLSSAVTDAVSIRPSFARTMNAVSTTVVGGGKNADYFDIFP